MIFNATVQTCIFGSTIDGDTDREGSGLRLLSNNGTTPKASGRSATHYGSGCAIAGLNATRQELAALMNEVAKMKPAHSAEIAGLKDELHHKVDEGQEESRRAHEESRRAQEESRRAQAESRRAQEEFRRAQAETRELMLPLLAGRNR